MSYPLSSSKFDNTDLPVLMKRLATYFAKQGIPFYVVGAMARDLVLGHIHGRKPARKTNDLDIAIMVPDWAAFEKVGGDLGADPDFTKSPKQKQRWHFKGQVILDIIPFGEIAAADKNIYWPPDETPAMSVSGFSAMASSALEVILDGEVSLGVASLPGLFVLKLLAWNDRNYDRDAADMMNILSEYIEINYERAAQEHSDIFEREEYTVLGAGALLMGRNIRSLLAVDIAVLEEVRNILESELGKREHSMLIHRILETHQSKRYDEVLSALMLLESALKQ